MQKNVNQWIKLTHEAKKKTDTIELSTDDAPVTSFYQGNRRKCFTYSLASAIKYLSSSKILSGIDHLLEQLINISQQDHKLVNKANNVLRKNGLFKCNKLNKRKQKRSTAMNILEVKMVKNTIYLCSLVTFMGDNL